MLRTVFTILILSLIILTTFLPVQSLQASELEPVTIQLDWKYQFEYAGFIAAKEHGFYEAEMSCRNEPIMVSTIQVWLSLTKKSNQRCCWQPTFNIHR